MLVVLDRIESYGAEIDRTSVIVSELSLKYGVSVSRVFFSLRLDRVKLGEEILCPNELPERLP